MTMPIMLSQDYTVFTLSDCIYCDKVKTLLKSKKVEYVLCDEDIKYNKEIFLEQMDRLTHNSNHRTFPFVFKEKIFLGGYEETREILDKELIFHEEDF